MKKLSLSFEQPWPLHLLTVLLITLTYVLAIASGQQQRDTLATIIAEGNQRLAVGNDILTHAGQYREAAHSISQELGSVHIARDENQALSELLVELDRSAQTRNVQFAGLDPQRDHTTAGGLDLAIHVRGHYGDLMKYVGDLAMMHSVMVFDSLDFQRDPHTVHAGQAPTIDATVSMTLLTSLPGIQGE